jgi:hypothetical protein
MLMNKKFVLLTGIALFGSFGVASAAEPTGPVKLTAMQMDEVKAGFNVNGIVFDFGDIVKINNQTAVITQVNLGSVINGLLNQSATIVQINGSP